MGIVILTMITISFLLVVIIPDFLLHTIVVFILSYSLLGYLMRAVTFPYFAAYMMACTLVIINALFSQLFFGIPLLFEPDITFFSFLTASIIALTSVFIFRKIEERRAYSWEMPHNIIMNSYWMSSGTALLSSFLSGLWCQTIVTLSWRSIGVAVKTFYIYSWTY